jgi:hypothetical protein
MRSMVPADSGGNPAPRSVWFQIGLLTVIVLAGMLFFFIASGMMHRQYLNRSPEPNATPTPNPPAMSP